MKVNVWRQREGSRDTWTHGPSGNMVETPGRAVLQVEAGAVDLDFQERDFAYAESDEGKGRRGSGEGKREGELD